MIFYNAFWKTLFFGIFLISTTTCIPRNESEKVVSDSSACVCVLNDQCDQMTTVLPSVFQLRFGGDDEQQCSSSETCCPKDKIKEEPKKRCGESMNIVLSRIDITKANDSTDYPWTMALFKKTNENLTFLCGASLLAPKVAVTVIHNIPEQPTSLVVRAGEFDLSNDNEWLPHQDRVVTRIVKHPKYNNLTHVYDIALLFWDEPLNIGNGNVNTICLPSENESFDNLYCTVTGWGTSDADPSASISNEMKYLEIKVVEKLECEKSINHAANQTGFILDKSFICAGGESGKDTCQGDGGSPLVCRRPGESSYKLAGLVVMGIECGKPVPAIYANIPFLVKWINAEIAQTEIFDIFT